MWRLETARKITDSNDSCVTLSKPGGKWSSSRFPASTSLRDFARKLACSAEDNNSYSQNRLLRPSNTYSVGEARGNATIFPSLNSAFVLIPEYDRTCNNEVHNETQIIRSRLISKAP